MYKTITSLFLCVVFLMCFAVPVFATESAVNDESETIYGGIITIDSLDEFLAFSENCRLDSYSENLTVSLETDLDLTGSGFESIPIFSGTFEGNGHLVTGLTITTEGSAQGLFRYLTVSAVVRNLNVAGDVNPGGSRADVGGLAGSNEGSILNCSFNGTVSGSSTVGGLVGSNAVTGVIENCRVDGQIHGSYFIGGIAGENGGVIRECVNHAEINTTAQQNTVSLSDITMDTLTNSESANTVTDIGGIAGISSGVIRSCENRGNVGYQQMGYNIGGIAGTQVGYITDCENYAEIQGRKEVGGIVGQMEPASLIEYSEDTLQILQDQLSTMSGLVNRASGNAQTNASQISSQIALLRDQAQTAQNAVDSLFPDSDHLELPDEDSILAAQNTLSSTINAMPGTLNSIAAATQTTVSGLTRDLQAISGQINTMGETINNASENLGGSFTDISDRDTAETLTGKVENCTNYGNLLADMSVGGIAGAMAMENDLDILEDWETSGENSLNFESEIRAVILNCENQGTVTGKKQNAGGIAGWQSMGLVKGCANTGTLDAANADYVAGISGLSNGFIRSSSAKCKIIGSTYVGGIAGSATIATDCRSMVLITGSIEKQGAILGNAEQDYTGEEHPILGNFYLNISEDIGAIDGISYEGMAEPLSLDAFLSLENLSDLFKYVTIRFLFEDGTEQCIFVAPGGKLSESQIPAIPEKEGCVGLWEGLEDTDLTNIMFDKTFDAVYTAHSTVIQSQETRENGLPLLLVQGTFTNSASVSASESDAKPGLDETANLAEVWAISISERDSVTAVRFLVPDESGTENLQLLVCSENGQWRESEYTADGRYISFSWNQDDTHIAMAEAESMNWLWLAAWAGIVVIGLLGILIFRRKRNAKKDGNPTEETPM